MESWGRKYYISKSTHRKDLIYTPIHSGYTSLYANLRGHKAVSAIERKFFNENSVQNSLLVYFRSLRRHYRFINEVQIRKLFSPNETPNSPNVTA